MSKSKQKKKLERNSKTKAKLTYSVRITKGFTVSTLISSTFQIFFPKNPTIPLSKCYHSFCSVFLFTFFPENGLNVQYPLSKSLLPLFY